MAKIWLPPIETCCDECNLVVIHVHSNATLHFSLDCPAHGLKGIPSIFAKSAKINYRVIVSEGAGGKKNAFHKNAPVEQVPGQEPLYKGYESQTQNK